MTSKYFPLDENSRLSIKKSKTEITLVAVGLLCTSLYFFSRNYAIATALVIWIFAFVAILSTLIITMKFNVKWIYVWGILCILFLTIDFL